MTETLFNSQGVKVWADDGRLYISDELGTDDFEDTENNRRIALWSAKQLVGGVDDS